jgi:ATP-dependent Lon protease
MDRFAAYIPGWEMPKNSSDFLTNHYGFITDYLAEAFHYQFKHTNRYEEVGRRIRLGKSIEGRDEKGIKKTVCALLKILHPDGPPSDAEFEEYVAYATECRRRVKEQMNKRKPDDEFARINLSFFRTTGEEVVVFCPESKDAPATQDPARRRLHSVAGQPLPSPAPPSDPGQVVVAPTIPPPSLSASPTLAEPSEQHFTIHYGDTGYGYETIFGPYLSGVTSIIVEDPYIRQPYQVQNFVRFCEMVLKADTLRHIYLCTGYDDDLQKSEMVEHLAELQ